MFSVTCRRNERRAANLLKTIVFQEERLIDSLSAPRARQPNGLAPNENPLYLEN
jgi:hypothetical protein